MGSARAVAGRFLLFAGGLRGRLGLSKCVSTDARTVSRRPSERRRPPPVVDFPAESSSSEAEDQESSGQMAPARRYRQSSQQNSTARLPGRAPPRLRERLTRFVAAVAASLIAATIGFLVAAYSSVGDLESELAGIDLALREHRSISFAHVEQEIKTLKALMGSFEKRSCERAHNGLQGKMGDVENGLGRLELALGRLEIEYMKHADLDFIRHKRDLEVLTVRFGAFEKRVALYEQGGRDQAQDSIED